MPEFTEASEGLEETFDEVWELHRDVLPSDAFEALDDHLDEIEGYNRGHTSTAYTKMRKGPNSGPMKLRLQNNAFRSTHYHEMGHALADALGYDTSQEATDRACNKTNYSRWPQFSFGKKDSPCERFMMRRYGDLPDLPRITDFDMEDIEGRADLFFKDDKWWEPYGYKYATDRRENKRYHDPFSETSVKTCPLDTGSTRHIDESQFGDDAELVDRYKLTPGLTEVLSEDHQVEWSGFDSVMYQVNKHWHEAVTLVRKRGDARERGQNKCIRNDKSYYLMNCHEYFAELHSKMMLAETGSDSAEDDIERLRESCPGLIETYEDWLTL